MEAKWIYLYAGYYELIITDKVLAAPYVFISRHKTVRTAENAAEKYDSDAWVTYDKDVAGYSQYDTIADPEYDDYEIHTYDFSGMAV